MGRKTETEWPHRIPVPLHVTKMLGIGANLVLIPPMAATSSNPALILTGLLIPIAHAVVLTWQARYHRFKSEAHRAVVGEDATALRGESVIHLAEGGRSLHCSFTDGRFSRVRLSEIESVQLRPPPPRTPGWSLKLRRHDDTSIQINFLTSIDAEIWYWRLHLAEPALGLEAARHRAVDVYGSLPDKILARLGTVTKPADPDAPAPLLAGVTPEFAEAFVANHRKRSNNLDIRPAGLSAFPARVRLENRRPSRPRRALSQAPRPAPVSLDPLLTVLNWLISVVLFGYIAPQGGALAGFLFLGYTFFSIEPVVKWLLSDFQVRRQSLLRKGMPEQELLEIGIEEKVENRHFVFIPPGSRVGFASHEGHDCIKFQVESICGIHLKDSDGGVRLEIERKKRPIRYVGSHKSMENFFWRWQLELQANPHLPEMPFPELQTVVVDEVDPSAPSSLPSLRERWLTADALPPQGQLVIGPLVGPVTPYYAHALVKYLAAFGIKARVVPYRAEDPKPMATAPGTPWLAAALRERNRVKTTKSLPNPEVP